MLTRLNEDIFSDFGVYITRPEKLSVTDQGDYLKYWHDVHKKYLGSNEITTGILSIFKQPFVLSEMERHQQYGEIFTTIKGRAVLSVALADAMDDDKIDVLKLKFFLLEEGDAVLLKKGTWHLPPLPIDESVDFLMILPEQILSDIDKRQLKNPQEIPNK